MENNDLFIEYQNSEHCDTMEFSEWQSLQIIAFREKKNKKRNKRKRIIQMDLEGNDIETFNTITEAAEKTNTPRTAISMVALGQRKQTGGFRWRYKE